MLFWLWVIDMFHRLAELRADHDIKQVELAAYLNITQATYSDYENGKINIPVESLVKLADYYHVSLDYLVGREPAGGRGAPVKPGRYRHFKGNEYLVLYNARHSETLEPLVVYQALYGERGIWVRPAGMWNEHVERDGYSGPRFVYLGE